MKPKLCYHTRLFLKIKSVLDKIYACLLLIIENIPTSFEILLAHYFKK